MRRSDFLTAIAYALAALALPVEEEKDKYTEPIIDTGDPVDRCNNARILCTPYRDRGYSKWSRGVSGMYHRGVWVDESAEVKDELYRYEIPVIFLGVDKGYVVRTGFTGFTEVTEIEMTKNG